MVGPHAPVEGKVKDRRSKIKRVTVTYCRGTTSNGGWVCEGIAESERATLDCDDSYRKCSWSWAPATLVPGSYWIFAEAKDKAGNVINKGPLGVVVV